MAAGQGRQNRRQTAYRNTNSGHIQGNTVRKPVRKPDAERRIQEVPNKKVSHATRKNRDKARHMNIGYMAFLSMAMIVAGLVLVSYIRLQSEITSNIKYVSRLEKDLNNKKLENEEEYSRILSAVNLEEIKRVAVEELGMTYANQGQVISYSSEGNDYVRQYALVPEE